MRDTMTALRNGTSAWPAILEHLDMLPRSTKQPEEQVTCHWGWMLEPDATWATQGRLYRHIAHGRLYRRTLRAETKWNLQRNMQLKERALCKMFGQKAAWNYEMRPVHPVRQNVGGMKVPKMRRKMSNLLSSKKIQDYSDIWPDQDKFIDYQPDPIRKMSVG